MADLMTRIRQRITVSDGGCWLWEGATSKGYGRITFGSRTDGTRRTDYTHRVTYRLARGEVPAGLVLDHLCNTPRCCNPDHLKPTTRGENGMRRGKSLTAINRAKTHCDQCGGELTWLPNDGCRGCAPCVRNYRTKWMREHYREGVRRAG